MTDLAAIRYDLIAPLLRRYKRRFTLLDLGAGINPYVTQRISREFDAHVIAVEQDEIAPDELAQFGPRALWLRHKMSAADLLRLGCCEHFDVVLALNFLHHFDVTDWYFAAKAIESMASLVIIQAPHVGDDGTCGRELLPEIHNWLADYTQIGQSVQFPGHMSRPIFMKRATRGSKLTMTNWNSPENCADIRITAGFTSKTIRLVHKHGPLRPFIHGLNLWNFAQLGGSWPRKEAVLKLIREFPLPNEHHGDITAHNFLFDGAALHLIDGHEGWEFDDAAGLRDTEAKIEAVLQ